MKTLLCAFGFHRWEAWREERYYNPLWDEDVYIRKRACEHCGMFQAREALVPWRFIRR